MYWNLASKREPPGQVQPLEVLEPPEVQGQTQERVPQRWQPKEQRPLACEYSALWWKRRFWEPPPGLELALAWQEPLEKLGLELPREHSPLESSA